MNAARALSLPRCRSLSQPNPTVERISLSVVSKVTGYPPVGRYTRCAFRTPFFSPFSRIQAQKIDREREIDLLLSKRDSEVTLRPASLSLSAPPLTSAVVQATKIAEAEAETESLERDIEQISEQIPVFIPPMLATCSAHTATVEGGGRVVPHTSNSPSHGLRRIYESSWRLRGSRWRSLLFAHHPQCLCLPE
jgi:hypothetical protein